MRSSTHGPALEGFVARFGDRARLATEAVTRSQVAEDCPIDDLAFRVRVGASVRRTGGEPVEWAFEFTKQ